MPNPLIESVSANPHRKGKRWLVTIARPGKGSTGIYSADLLREYGPKAFPPGTRSYMGHARPEDRDARDILGNLPEGAFWNSEAEELQAVLESRNPKWEEFLEHTYDVIDMSMCVFDYKKDAEGNITYLGHTRANSVDVVGIGGLEGAGIKELVESARTYDFTTSTDSVEENRKTMEIEKLVEALNAKVEGLTTKIDSLVTVLSENAVQEAQVEADKKAVATAVEEALTQYSASEALIESAREDLTASQIESLRESAVAGEDITKLVENYKKSTQEAREGFVAKEHISESFILPSEGSEDKFTGPTSWRNK